MTNHLARLAVLYSVVFREGVETRMNPGGIYLWRPKEKRWISITADLDVQGTFSMFFFQHL